MARRKDSEAVTIHFTPTECSWLVNTLSNAIEEQKRLYDMPEAKQDWFKNLIDLWIENYTNLQDRILDAKVLKNKK